MKHFKFLFLILPTLIGCQMSYIVKSGYHQMRLLSKEESFESALKNQRLDENTKRKIRLVQEVKDFAENQIGLARTKNYRTFVLLDDRYVVYAVTAAYKNRLEPYLWSFPIVGKVPYKGFFKESEADEEKILLEKINLDAYKRGVSAFSTLGWLSDPLLSSMTLYDDASLVETIIHETTHATVYLKSNADFNERLATFVGNKGMVEFYTLKEGVHSKTLETASLQDQDTRTFSQFISVELKKLEDFYKSYATHPKLETLRQERFQEIKKHFETHCRPQLKTKSYDYFSKLTLNNAVLVNYKTYYQDLDLFEKAFQKSRSQWPTFLQLFKEMKNEASPEKRLQQWVAGD